MSELAMLHCDLDLTLLAREGYVQEGQVDMLAYMNAAGRAFMHAAQTCITSTWVTCLVMSKVAICEAWASILQSQSGCDSATSM